MATISIGFLVATTRHAWSEFTDAFEDELRKLGNDFKIEYQSASGLQNLYDEIANDFADPKRSVPIDIIVTGGTGPALACKRATAALKPLPVVFATAGDPAFSKLVTTNASPGGNLTGISNGQTDPDLIRTRLVFMRDKLSADHRKIVVGAIGNADNTNVQLEMKRVGDAASDLGLGFFARPLRGLDDIHQAIKDLKNDGANVLFVCTDPLITTNADILNEWALLENLATMHTFRENCGKGGLMFYGPIFPKMFRRAADFVDMILNAGVSPANIPVKVADEFESKCNKKTAEILGLKSLVATL
jgi:putative ABC transport system substrate-binding protein